jgi:hypothetical protein
MSEPSSPCDWRTLYAVAMLEGNGTQIQFRVERAEEAIQARLRGLPKDCSGGSEQAELQSAAQNLRRLKSGLTSV